MASSFGSMRVTDREVEKCEKARFFSNDSSSDSDNETCSSEMGWSFGSFGDLNKRGGVSRTATVESIKKSPARSVNSYSGPARNTKFYNSPAQNAESYSKGITPFVSSTNRKLVMEKFGNIVSSLRKPGHHIGPSKNSDCMCDNCRSFFCKK